MTQAQVLDPFDKAASNSTRSPSMKEYSLLVAGEELRQSSHHPNDNDDDDDIVPMEDDPEVVSKLRTEQNSNQQKGGDNDDDEGDHDLEETVRSTISTPSTTHDDDNEGEEEEEIVFEDTELARTPTGRTDDIINNFTSESSERRMLVSEWKPSPLAWASTTPWLIKCLLPLFILATHIVFYYGQSRPMWQLIEQYDIDLSINATGMEAKFIMDAAGLDYHQHVHRESYKIVKTFNYTYALHELWKAKHMPGQVLPRTAAVLLALCSGVWPHLKLFMLLLTWLFSKRMVRRKRTLNSLSILGKWSLADVLVVCVMIGVLHLQVDFTGETLQQGIENHLPVLVQLLASQYSAQDLCAKALKFSCQQPSNLKHKLQCATCTKAIQSVYDHPDKTATPILEGLVFTGQGHGQLTVSGLRGIYAFCAAVISSILLSVVVDWYDARDRKHRSRWLSQQQQGQEQILEQGSTAELIRQENDDVGQEEDEGIVDDMNEQNELRRPLLLPIEQGTDDDLAPFDMLGLGELPERQRRMLVVHSVEESVDSDPPCCRLRVWAALAIAVGVMVATSWTTMERKVFGAAPKLLHDVLGVQWTRPYSFLELAYTTGEAGGWDWLLMGTFLLFIVVGPTARAFLCIIASLRQVKGRKRMARWIDFIGAFCAWEVLLMAIFMVDLVMPATTSTVLLNPKCQVLDPHGTCLEVKFDMRQMCWLVVISGVLLSLQAARLHS